MQVLDTHPENACFPEPSRRGSERAKINAESRADVAQPVEQRFRNFLCSITANSARSLGIGDTTGGRHRIRHTELLCRPLESSPRERWSENRGPSLWSNAFRKPSRRPSAQFGWSEAYCRRLARRPEPRAAASGDPVPNAPRARAFPSLVLCWSAF